MTESLIFFLLGLLGAFALVFLRRRYAEFHGQSPQDYDESFPVMHIKEHLKGQMVCDGVIYGPLGRMTSSFTADFDIKWDGDMGTMAERFRYNDGSVQDRAWQIKLRDNGRFICTAEDVPGEGLGTVAGPTVQMLYKIRLPEESGGHVLNTRDWMYLTPDGTIVNRSQFRKFGIKVAELVATIRPKEAA